jgi:thioredoxin reductase (NADPH)
MRDRACAPPRQPIASEFQLKGDAELPVRVIPGLAQREQDPRQICQNFLIRTGNLPLPTLSGPAIGGGHMATHTTRMLIIGSGPAGLSAAIYGARAGLAPIVVQGLQPGGQLTITTDVENYPGFRDVIQGPWLMDEMQAQAEHVGTRMLWDTITSVDLSGPPFRAIGDGGDIYEGETLVIATGAQAKWLGVPGEQELGGKGVSACATCDGFFYRGKKVVVIGGGNTAVEEALYLTNHSPDVTLIHRRDSLRAEKILQDRLFANPKISVVWNKKVDGFVGNPLAGGLTGVAVTDTVTGESSEISTEGAFVAIGHAPATELFKGQLAMDDGGYLLVEPGTPKTAIPGVFACGDVMDQVYRQAVTAAGTGCMAALDAERFIAEREFAANKARAKAEV